jgi:hypothetical protein
MRLLFALFSSVCQIFSIFIFVIAFLKYQTTLPKQNISRFRDEEENLLPDFIFLHINFA